MGSPEIWCEAGVVSEGGAIDIGGLDPWKYSWVSLGRQKITVPNITFPDKQYERYVYEIQYDQNVVRFSAEEVSANVWRFYVPSSSKA